jgi:hypothetical protein
MEARVDQPRERGVLYEEALPQDGGSMCASCDTAKRLSEPLRIDYRAIE